MWQKGQKRASIWVRVQGIKSMDFQVVSKVQGLEDLQPPFRPRKKVIFQLGTASAHLAVEAAQLVCDLMVKRGIKRWCFMMGIYHYTSLYIISLYNYISLYLQTPGIAKGRSRACQCCDMKSRPDLGRSWMITRNVEWQHAFFQGFPGGIFAIFAAWFKNPIVQYSSVAWGFQDQC